MNDRFSYIGDTAVLEDTSRGMPLTQEELNIIKEAARRFANSGPPEIPEVADLPWRWQVPEAADLATRWREFVEPLAKKSGYASPSHWIGSRLVETYAVIYPSLEAEGSIDSWGGSESQSVLCTLALTLPRDGQQRWCCVREAMGVAYAEGAGRGEF